MGQVTHANLIGCTRPNRILEKVKGRRDLCAEAEVPPVILVSIASKEFSRLVSLLFATLAERCISVDSKQLNVPVKFAENLQ